MFLEAVCNRLRQGMILPVIAVLWYLRILEMRDYENLHGYQPSSEGFVLGMALLFLFVLTLVLEMCRDELLGFC